MARSMANQQQLFKPEAEPGVAETTGFKAWSAIKIMPGWDGEAEGYQGGSSKLDTSLDMVDETAAMDATMTADFNHLGFVAASRVALPSTSTPGGGTLSREHVFEIDPDREDTKRTYHLLLGDQWEAQQVLYAVFNTLGMDIKRGQVEFSTSMIGRPGDYGYELPTNEVQTLTVNGTPTTGGYTITLPFLNNGAGRTTASIALAATASVIKAAIVLLADIDADDVDVTGGPIASAPVVLTFKGRYGQKDLALVSIVDTFDTGGIDVAQTTAGAKPTYVPDAPMPAIAWDAYADDAWDDLGETQLLAAYQGNVDLGDKFEPDAPINSSVIGYESLVEKEDQEHTFTLVVGVDATAVALIASFKAGAKKFIRLRVLGPIIEGALRYECYIDLCILIRGRGKVAAAPNSPAVSIPLTCSIARDDESGKGFRLFLRNIVESY